MAFSYAFVNETKAVVSTLHHQTAAAVAIQINYLIYFYRLYFQEFGIVVAVAFAFPFHFIFAILKPCR